MINNDQLLTYESTIDANKTLFHSVVNVINRLRYQADNNPNTFKQIIKGIIVDDVLQWSREKQPHEVQNHLTKLRDKIFLCSPALIVEKDKFSSRYVNVNTPQTNSDWQQLWYRSYAEVNNDNAVIPGLDKVGEYLQESELVNRAVVEQIEVRDLIQR